RLCTDRPGVLILIGIRDSPGVGQQAGLTYPERGPGRRCPNSRAPAMWTNRSVDPAGVDHAGSAGPAPPGPGRSAGPAPSGPSHSVRPGRVDGPAGPATAGRHLDGPRAWTSFDRASPATGARGPDTTPQGKAPGQARVDASGPPSACAPDRDGLDQGAGPMRAGPRWLGPGRRTRPAMEPTTTPVDRRLGLRRGGVARDVPRGPTRCTRRRGRSPRPLGGRAARSVTVAAVAFAPPPGDAKEDATS